MIKLCQDSNSDLPVMLLLMISVWASPDVLQATVQFKLKTQCPQNFKGLGLECASWTINIHMISVNFLGGCD